MMMKSSVATVSVFPTRTNSRRRLLVLVGTRLIEEALNDALDVIDALVEAAVRGVRWHSMSLYHERGEVVSEERHLPLKGPTSISPVLPQLHRQSVNDAEDG